LDNWFKIELLFAKNLNITPVELGELEFYRVEYLLENYEAFVKEENKQYENQQKDYQKESTSQLPKQPKLDTPRLPKMDIPKMQYPKF